MTLVKKAPAPSENENIVIVCKKNSNISFFGISASEIEYAKIEFEKKDKKLVVINQLRRVIILSLFDKKEKEPLTLEACRRAGDKIATYLNDNKKESVVIVDAIGDAKGTLALAEGIALSNYQFIKYIEPLVGFKLKPPVSYTTPFPTSTMGFLFFARLGFHSMIVNEGGSTLPKFTASNPPIPSY